MKMALGQGDSIATFQGGKKGLRCGCLRSQHGCRAGEASIGTKVGQQSDMSRIGIG